MADQDETPLRTIQDADLDDLDNSLVPPSQENKGRSQGGKPIPIKTVHQLKGEAEAQRYEELARRVKKVDEVTTRIRKLQEADQAAQTENTINSLIEEAPFGQPQNSPESQEQEGQATDRGRGQGESLTQKAGAAIKNAAQDQATNLAKKAVKSAAANTAKEGVELGAEALGLATGVGEVLIAFDLIKWVLKHKKQIISVIIGGTTILVLIFIAISFALGDPASAGTGPVTPISTSSSVDMSSLRQVLAGGTVTKDLAQRILGTANTLKTQNAGSNASVLDDIAAAAQAIISNTSDDPAVNSKETAILKDKIQQYLQSADQGSCQKYPGATCLAVPPIGEGYNALCAVTSMVMLFLYYNPSYTSPTYYDPNQNYSYKDKRRPPAGVKLTNPQAPNSCPSDAIINSEIAKSPFPNAKGKNDFKRISWHDSGYSKDKIIDIMKNSIAQGDPVILYSIHGGFFADSKHVVIVIGYDPSDHSFIVNNPVRFNVVAATKFNHAHEKLDENHIKTYMGGDGTDDYSHSIIVRSVYTK